MNKIYITWHTVEILVDNLHRKILKTNFEAEHIMGLPRGGLIPAVILSHKMGIPLTNNILDDKILIIDDICDSGETLQKFSKFHTAALHYKPHTSIFEPHFYANTHNSDGWIVYPWENKDSKPIQDYKNKING